MEVLKKKILDCMNDLNQKWVEAIKEGEKKGGIDLSNMFGEYSTINSKLNEALKEFQDRSQGKQKKGWLS